MSEGQRSAAAGRPQRGAATQRLVLALAASAILTAAVALPMAYQAREARRQEAARLDEAQAEVLGATQQATTTTTAPPADLVWATPTDPDPRPLDGATLSGTVVISLVSDTIVRADFRLDLDPVETDLDAPWQLRDGDPLDAGSLGAGTHSVTVTTTSADGRSELRQAFFEVEPG